MAISLIQQNNAAGNTSISVAYSSAVTPGNVLIAAFGWTNSARSISSLGDNQFNANWNTAKGQGSGASVAGLFYLPSVASANVIPTVTATLNGSSACHLTVMEFSGLSALLDQTGAATLGSGTSLSVSSSGATTNATELVVTSIELNSSTTFTAGSGYTLVSSNSFQGTQWAATTSTGTQTANMTWTGAAGGNAVLATFFPAGTTVPQPIYSRRYVQYNI